MKKFGLVATLCCILFISACGSNKGSYSQVSYEEYTKKKSNKDTFMLLIGSDTCVYCIEYKEKVLDSYLIDNSLVVYELNFSNHEDAVEKVKAEYPDFQGTPTTIVFEKGEVVFNNAGALSTDQLKDLTEAYNLSK